MLLAVMLVFGCQSSSRAQSPLAGSQTEAPPVLATMGFLQSWSQDLLQGIEEPGAPLASVLLKETPDLTSEQEGILRRANILVAHGSSHDRYLVERYRELRPNGLVVIARADASDRMTWLDPVVAREDIASLADQFSQIFVGEAARIHENRDRLLARIAQAETRSARLMAPYAGTEVLVENANLRPLIDVWGLGIAAYFEPTPGRPPQEEALNAWRERADSLEFPLAIATRQLGAEALRNGDDVPRITGVVVNAMRAGSLGTDYYAREMERNAMLFVAAIEPLRRSAHAEPVEAVETP